jgi:hypothetical protein
MRRFGSTLRLVPSSLTGFLGGCACGSCGEELICDSTGLERRGGERKREGVTSRKGGSGAGAGARRIALLRLQIARSAAIILSTSCVVCGRARIGDSLRTTALSGLNTGRGRLYCHFLD